MPRSRKHRIGSMAASTAPGPGRPRSARGCSTEWSGLVVCPPPSSWAWPAASKSASREPSPCLRNEPATAAPVAAETPNRDRRRARTPRPCGPRRSSDSRCIEAAAAPDAATPPEPPVPSRLPAPVSAGPGAAGVGRRHPRLVAGDRSARSTSRLRELLQDRLRWLDEYDRTVAGSSEGDPPRTEPGTAGRRGQGRAWTGSRAS